VKSRRVLRNLTYLPGGHERHTLDLFLPEESLAPASFPVLLWIHGGALLAGDKENCPYLWLVERGWAVASTNYRLSMHARYPAAVSDVASAVRFLKSRSETYRLDTKRIALAGHSAGGYLAALVGVAGDETAFRAGPHTRLSARVSQVVFQSGLSDFADLYTGPNPVPTPPEDAPEARFYGGSVLGVPREARESCPLTYISTSNKRLPAFFLTHSTDDNVVPIRQAERLESALKLVRASVIFRRLPSGGHGFPIDLETSAQIARFLAATQGS
jgi:acetyl esterase/lipase